tara:strand:+ start:1679 stop:1954 length:276 start_codon:yes stop_codon:yes gene_type:complete
MLEQENPIMIHSDRRHKEETQDHTDRRTDNSILPHMRNPPMTLRQKKKQPEPPAPAPSPSAPPSTDPTPWPWYVWAFIIFGILICLGQLSN